MPGSGLGAQDNLTPKLIIVVQGHPSRRNAARFSPARSSQVPEMINKASCLQPRPPTPSCSLIPQLARSSPPQPLPVAPRLVWPPEATLHQACLRASHPDTCQDSGHLPAVAENCSGCGRGPARSTWVGAGPPPCGPCPRMLPSWLLARGQLGGPVPSQPHP